MQTALGEGKEAGEAGVEVGGEVGVGARGGDHAVVSLVEQFGGGGHARAAGFKIAKGNLETIKKQLLKAVKEKLK